jgi:hypothetical protein
MPALRTRDTQSRSALEVTTDAPLQPPTLAIISPTPRAFIFPINKADPPASPYSSPSSSPFEPDLKPFTLSPSSLARTLSPVSSITSVSSTQSSPSVISHKRRKSSTSSEIEHRPKKGDEDYVKRPENAFILFRRHCCEERQAAADEADTPAKKQRQADLSKTISQQWKSLSAEERQVWEDRAKEKKKEHEQLHPNYVYRPQRSKAKKSKGKYDEADTESNISFMLPLHAPSSRHGRSASAPTPPLGYQSIQLPNIYMPSCPTSPSLMGRRSSHPGHSEERTSHFDYLPSETLMPPSFSQPPTGYEGNLAPPEFYQGMFNMPDPSPFTDKHNALQPLTMPEQPMMLSPLELVSPSSSTSSNSIPSGYSSPTSPQAGPFTPVHTLHRQYSLDDCELGHLSESRPIDCDSPTDLGMPYPAYSWENTDMWANGSEMMLGEDFDLNSIPPIELGNAKFQDDLNQFDSPPPMQEYSHDPYALQNEQYHLDPHAQGSFNGLFFDDMMSGHGF